VSDLFEYITKEGERFDQVAYKAYGKSTLVTTIIQANPKVPIVPKLPAGVVLYIPVLDEVSVKTDKELLPPWKV
jgi:phage tail protein X